MSLRGAPGFIFLILLAGCAADSPRPVVAPVATESPSAGPETFQQLWDRARNDSAGPQGKDWERANNDALEEILDECNRICSRSPSLVDGDEPDTAFVLEIDRGGRVGKVHFSGNSDHTECRRNVLTHAVFSPPPRVGYHFGVLLAGRLQVPDPPRTRLPETTTFKDASIRALMDVNTGAAMQWVTSGQESLSTAIRSLRTHCPALFESRDADILVTFEVASDGAVRRVLAADATHLDCVRSDLQQQRLAAPPWDGLWFPVIIGRK